MRLPWRTSAQAPYYARNWSEQRHLGYLTFGVSLGVALGILYGLLALSQSDISGWRFILLK